jgi:hypothetical protein
MPICALQTEEFQRIPSFLDLFEDTLPFAVVTNILSNDNDYKWLYQAHHTKREQQ